MMFLLSIFLMLITVSIFTVFVCTQNKFLITSCGIQFPLRLLFELRWRLKRPWTEMQELRFAKGVAGSGKYYSSEEPDLMIVPFIDGGTLALELAAFKREDLQNFILAVQSYVPNLPISPPLSEVRLGITADSTAQKALSFTQIWEDDMSSRFGSTVFVPLEPGQKLQNGALEILGQIAFGGLSAIYLAKNKSSQLCVIKEAVIPASADEEARQKAMELFQRESQILMALKHPRIAKVNDYFVEAGRHYMVLEHIDGKDLRKYVKEKGPQSETMVLRWTAEIADILAYLHKLDPPIVHRDLTPDNLVLVADGSVTLIDFGAANEFLGTATGTLVGKQSYISPEQFRGKANPKSDLYSLGATMFYLLTGQDPEALSQSHPKQSDASLSDEVESLVAELTALDTSKRIESAVHVASKARELLAKKKRQNTSAGAQA
jgi:tRNA A-37 threonylcarbamoyl transferase component Bud32